MWRLDPITHTELEDPYLASDGITYSKTSIQTAMQADAWHRSPVTGEVLRPWGYKNSIIAQLLANSSHDSSGCGGPLLLFDEDMEGAGLPENGGRVTWTLPKLCTAQMAAFKVKWKLDEEVDADISIGVRVLPDASGLLWLMHPPSTEEMWSDCLELAKLLSIHKLVANPWCLTTALICINGHLHSTVEQQWMSVQK
jgi:hypothetical protein